MLEDAVLRQGNGATVSSLISAVRPQFTALDDGLGQGCAKPLIRTVESEKTALDALDRAIEEKYPVRTTEQLRELSTVQFPMYRRGDYVSIRHRFKPNASKITRGVFRYVKNGKVWLNTSDHVNLSEMAGLPENEGPDGELAKYDDKLNRQYRQQWVEEASSRNEENRRNFRENNRDAFIARQIEADAVENERRGYTLWNGQWHAIDELLRENADAIIRRMERERDASREQQIALRTASVEAQARLSSRLAAIAPPGAFASAQQELARQEAEERARQEALAQQQREEQLKLEREKEEARLNAERKAREEERARRAAMQRREQQAAPAESKPDYVLYGIIALAVLGGLGGLGWWYHRRRAEERNLEVERFFANKGKLQQEFWDAADADPDHFKYVAYLFNDMDDAKDALNRLSFINMDSTGQLHCKRNDIRFGTYEHQGRAVAFIGGPTLNYARWREASMIWPELPFANYFRQSTEPVVSLELPNMDEMKGEIENLGSEDIRLENGEVNRVFRFKTTTREKALGFLDKFKIEEEGIVVRVETDHDGVLGKDINGIFTA